MNNKNRMLKPKSNSKQSPSPDTPVRAIATSPHLYSNHQTLSTPAQRPKAEPKRSQPTKQSIVIKSPVIKQARQHSSSGSQLMGSDIDKQDLLLLLEIKHLKRENNFLKKKIRELTAQQESYYPKKKTVPKNKGYQPQNVESLHLNVQYFFKEINNLLSSIGKLFKLNVERYEQNPSSEVNLLSNEQCPLQKSFLFKKYVLNRKLEKLLLQQQEKKYPSLLETFTEYYQYKEEAQKKILQNLDSMILKTNQLNKWLLEKAQIKKLKSEVYSISNKESIVTPERGFTYQFLKTPEPHSNRLTFSPGTKHTQTYRRNTDMSP